MHNNILQSLQELDEDDAKMRAELESKIAGSNSHIKLIEGFLGGLKTPHPSAGMKRKAADEDDPSDLAAATAKSRACCIRRRANNGGRTSSGNSSIVVQTQPRNEDNKRDLTNEQLAHELLLDPNFDIGREECMSDERLVHSKVRCILERAFWDSLRAELDAMPCSYGCVLRVLDTISREIQVRAVYSNVCKYEQTLSNLIECVFVEQDIAGRHDDIVQRIRDIIDLDLIRQQISKDAFSYADCMVLMGHVFGVIGSIHDRVKSRRQHKEQTEALWGEMLATMQQAASSSSGSKAECNRALCRSLELCMERARVIRLDKAMNIIRCIAPVIRTGGIQYEQSHFQKKLDVKISLYVCVCVCVCACAIECY